LKSNKLHRKQKMCLCEKVMRRHKSQNRGKVENLSILILEQDSPIDRRLDLCIIMYSFKDRGTLYIEENRWISSAIQ